MWGAQWCFPSIPPSGDLRRIQGPADDGRGPYSTMSIDRSSAFVFRRSRAQWGSYGEIVALSLARRGVAAVRIGRMGAATSGAALRLGRLTGPGVSSMEDVTHLISYELQGLPDRDAYLAAALTILTGLIPGDGVAWNSVDEATRTVEIVGNPLEVYSDAKWMQLMSAIRDNPMVRSYIDEPFHRTPPKPRRMSDIVSSRELRATTAYCEMFGPLGINYELTMLTARPSLQSGRCWAITRETSDFSDSEVSMAQAAQSILVGLDQVYHRGCSVRESHDVDPQGLTRREIEILQLVSHGHTAVTIARLLRISPNTVRKHQQNLYAKLDAHDRLQALNVAFNRGLLSSHWASCSKRQGPARS